MKVLIGYEKVPVRGGNLKLHQIKVYYKRNKEKLIQCTIIQPPSNAWRKIVEYARMLERRYNKKVDLKVVKCNGKKYLRFHRCDGIPIYISEEGHFYVSEMYRNKMALINVGIRFIAETCDYKIKTKVIVKNWIY